MPRAKEILTMVKEAFADWNEDNAPRLGAALSYYTAFSLAPLLVISIAIAGLVFGHEAAQGQIVAQMQGLMGKVGAEAVHEAAHKPATSAWAAILGTITLLIGASGAFTELRAALNIVWEAPPKPSAGLWGMIRERFLSFAAVLVLGFLLLISLVLSAGLAAVHGYALGLLPGAKVLLQVTNVAFCSRW